MFPVFPFNKIHSFFKGLITFTIYFISLSVRVIPVPETLSEAFSNAFITCL